MGILSYGTLTSEVEAALGLKSVVGAVSTAITGTHSGGNNSASLVDSTRNFVTAGVKVGDTVLNTTDGSSGVVTAISTTTTTNDTLAMTLAGGTQNDWDTGDAYSIDVTTADGVRLLGIIRAAEAFVKLSTDRSFELATHVNEAYDVDCDQDVLCLLDRPVVTWTSLLQVNSRDDSGNPSTQAIERINYVIDMQAGIVRMLGGSFPEGPQAVLANYTAGYTAGQISGNTADEIRVLKHLLLSIIDREHKLLMQGLHHVQSLGAGDESGSTQFDLTAMEQKMLDSLRLQ